jgi:hypothetical protein
MQQHKTYSSAGLDTKPITGFTPTGPGTRPQGVAQMGLAPKHRTDPSRPEHHTTDFPERAGDLTTGITAT